MNNHTQDLLETLQAISEWASSRDGTPETDELNLREISQLATAAIIYTKNY